ncbi:MAG: hypothetical protein IKZ03_07190 [Clostridia bacterium]|nr:hypothetical protein [Clostridia bacterium]
MYYGIVSIAVLMFSVQFFFTDRYEKGMGSGAASTFFYSLLTSVAGCICHFCVTGTNVGFTPFTFLIASATAVTYILFSYFSLKALGKINLSLYSVFSMLGGMMLPFVAGIVFYDEGITVGKIICIVLVMAALAFTIDRDGQKGGTLYYIGIFVLNGMSGVLAKIFDSAPYKTTDAASYSLWTAIIMTVISAVILIPMVKNLKRPRISELVYAFGGGAINQVANFLLVVSLAFIPASVQYPFITGGVMIASTVIAALTGQKPSKREIISVALSFIGLLALVFPVLN